MCITSSQAQNITSPNGNSLALFVDGVTGVMMLKDINGRTAPLSNYVCIGGGGGGTSPFQYNANGTGIQPVLGANDASGNYAIVGGGFLNNVLGDYSTIGGGTSNYVSGSRSTIGGGICNNASCFQSTIGGGSYNSSSSYESTVGGGGGNISSCNFSTVSGGNINIASGANSTVGGGYCNNASFSRATIGGGCRNVASADSTTVGGGYCNNASASFATIDGGKCNSVSNCYSSISGGLSNTVSGIVSLIAGGGSNIASNSFSVVTGGSQNTSSGSCSFIGGGRLNVANSTFGSILGGCANKTCGFACAMIIGSNLCATQACTTFMNCASADNLNVGCMVRVGNNKVLENNVFKIGSFYSTQSQCALSINTPTAMTLNNTDAFSSGISIVSNSRITVDSTGIYNLQFSAQIDRISGSGLDIMDIWYRVQGNDVPNTNTKVTISGSANQAKIVASWNFFISLTAGQYVELMYSVTDTNVHIVYGAENLTVPNPATPSLILTMQKIN